MDNKGDFDKNLHSSLCNLLYLYSLEFPIQPVFANASFLIHSSSSIIQMPLFSILNIWLVFNKERLVISCSVVWSQQSNVSDNVQWIWICFVFTFIILALICVVCNFVWTWNDYFHSKTYIFSYCYICFTGASSGFVSFI